MHVKESTVFLYENFELKHVTMVTDLRCFEKLGPGDRLSATIFCQK